MPVSGGISLPDANVWLALVFSDHVHHAKAKAWFDAQADGSCAFCRLTQMALLRHLTNAKIMGHFLQNQQEAWRSFDRLANDPRVVFLPEPPSAEASFRTFTQALSPAHALWTDAYLAAAAVGSQSRLVTFDQGFSRFSGLEVLILS
ncbi:MAG: TA system VapC family ribonuclease toxin [Verrucomicrobiota bacterium]|jgi:toxin-antitoxin system PIN domain toxin